ncbi:hypothetical protein WICPIJ_005794 [Wickerhamomyces pijperi]|uniref:DASH complex subunit DAM1 n=1 Tax=Wickerhamomyces pijperi TaxID=599730 RepID=A0A9P8TLH3_WICPI|nr:hypothetical protein WICPIJ_005794 [Wickerhamomyces pijperi]
MSKTPNNGTTPRSKIRTSNVLPSPMTHYPISQETPLRSTLLPRLIEFHDEYQDFESNMQSLQTVAENLRNFNESFSAFMYGLQINAYTVDFAKINDYVNPEYIEHNKVVISKIAELEKELEDLEQIGDSDLQQLNRNQEEEEPEEILSDDELLEMQQHQTPSARSNQRKPYSETRSTLFGRSSSLDTRKSYLPMRTNSTLSSSSQEPKGNNKTTTTTPTATTATTPDTNQQRRAIPSTSTSARRTPELNKIGIASRVPSSYRSIFKSGSTARAAAAATTKSSNSSSNNSSRPSSSSLRANYGRVQKQNNRTGAKSSSINNRPPFR